MPTTPVFVFVMLIIPNFVAMATATNHEQEQRFKLHLAVKRCNRSISSTPRPLTGIYCNMTFDDVMCWPYTPAGTVAKQHCAAYIKLFIVTEFATKRCMEDGKWDVNGGNKTWTNFSACVSSHKPKPPRWKEEDTLIMVHIQTVVLISRLGYSISLAVLLLAIGLMLIFKRLHCQRNIVHVNLFFSFALRAVLCLMKETVQGTGTEVQHDETGAALATEGTHWECKLLFTLLHYALGANYMWIFVEGLYLHTLIILAVFSHKHVFKWYILLGWLSPLLFVIPWVIVRVRLENTLCWNTHEGGYYWILKAPIIASIFVNFFFFINIIRVLFTKLMANIARDPRRYRKLAKSTLVLIPLFGVHYILFIIIPDELTPKLKLIKFYTETVLNSFQGVIVAFLFCFLNGEVRGEVMKKWRRHRLRRDSRLCNTRTSRAFSSASFFPRDRGNSLTTQNIAMTDMGQQNSVTTPTFFISENNPDSSDDSTVPNGTISDGGARNRLTDGNHVPLCNNLSRVSEDSEENTPMLFQKDVS